MFLCGGSLIVIGLILGAVNWGMSRNAVDEDTWVHMLRNDPEGHFVANLERTVYEGNITKKYDLNADGHIDSITRTLSVRTGSSSKPLLFRKTTYFQGAYEHKYVLETPSRILRSELSSGGAWGPETTKYKNELHVLTVKGLYVLAAVAAIAGLFMLIVVTMRSQRRGQKASTSQRVR
jgi:hypothetical protein